jgi:hypothetical protein
MRFMMLMIPDVYQHGKVDPNFVPDAAAVAEMGKFNDSLTRAGVLLALDGLQPRQPGCRVSYKGGKPAVLDGPYSETKEVLGGFWIIQARSLEEARAWALRIPAADGDIVEVRQIFDMADFPDDVRKAAGAE